MGKKFRIATGGIHHETNSFSPVGTGFEDFRRIHGNVILSERFPHFSSERLELIPTFYAEAISSGLVDKNAYLRLKETLLKQIQELLPLDGVHLDLHGAMEVEDIGDAEGDLAKAVRKILGEEVLISVSLDLHGNISPTLVDSVNILTAYRTAPHRDFEETRLRALSLLSDALEKQLRPVSALVKPPILLAGESAVTEREPTRSLYARLEEIDQVHGIMNSSLLVGCAWTDSNYTSTSIIVVAESDKNLAHQQAAMFAREVWAQRFNFDYGVESASVDEAIQRAMNAPEQPVFLSDSGDNVTAGAAGKRTLFLERLIEFKVQNALLAGLNDPVAVGKCVAAGTGAEVELTFGGESGENMPTTPLVLTGRVSGITIGKDLGGSDPTIAVVEFGNITAIICCDNRPFIDRETIAATGVDPMNKKLVVVKQGYLFPDLMDNAPRAIMALSPGSTDLDLKRLKYKNLSRPIFPLDTEVEFA